MNCPKCDYEMEKVKYSNIEVDRCRSCFGIWFDMLAEEHLKAMKGAQKIDVGNPGLGKAYDGRTDINCPACGTKMIPMVVPRQPHIRYESCGTCHGVFLDAGEFRDYKKETFLDWVRDLLAGERR